MGPEHLPAPPLRVSSSGCRHARRGWRSAVLALVLVAAAGLAWWLIGDRTNAPARTSPGPAAASGVSSAATRAQAASWIAGEVSDSAIIACDPDLCPVLQQRGVAAGQLMPLPSAAARPLRADLLVTSGPAAGLAERYQPALIASFGSGADRVEMFAVEPGGPSAYQAALRADLAARRSAGSQLLRNPHIRFTAPGAALLRAGQVDTRLLATLAVLAARYSFRVTALGDAAPGAPVLFREVGITMIGRDRPGALAMVRAQNPPYMPAHAVTVGQTGLNIEFALPSPLGLLSPVLGTGSPQPSPAGGALALRSNPFR